MIKSIENAEHYTWGNTCDGWHLLKMEIDLEFLVISEPKSHGDRINL